MGYSGILRSMRKAYLVPAIALLLFTVLCAFAQTGENESMVFQWGILMKLKDGSTNALDLSQRDVSLDPGEHYQIVLRPMRHANLYLFRNDTANGTLQMLFPADASSFSSDYEEGVRYTAPGKDSWFSGEKDDTFEIILVASCMPLKRLETLAKTYLTLLRISKDETDVKNARMDVLDEIRALKKKHSVFASASERPVPIAGDPRGEEEEVLLFGAHIETADFYAKTIRFTR